MIEVTCPHCGERSGADNATANSELTCGLCSASFSLGVRTPPKPAKGPESPSAAAIAGILACLVAVLVGGIFFMKFKADKRAEEARVAQLNVEREEGQTEKRKANEVKRQEGTARMEQERDLRRVSGGLTIFQVEARSLYMLAMAQRSKQGDDETDWFSRWKTFKEHRTAQSDLAEKLLTIADLIYLPAMEEFEATPTLEQPIIREWDEAFNLKNGEPRSEEQLAEIRQQETEANEKGLAESMKHDFKATPNPATNFTLLPEQMAAIIENVKSQGTTGATIKVKDESINLAFSVPFGTSKGRAKEIGENFVRLTMTLSSDNNPTAGLVKGKFSYMVGAVTPDEKWLVMGHKRATLSEITW